MNDWKYAVRQGLKFPGFTAVAVLTLALGIGANTVVFSVAKAVLLRPLGLDAPDRLMWIRRANPQTGATANRLSWRDLEDIRESARSLEASATFGSPGANWIEGDRVEQVPTLSVTPNLAEVLHVRPALGRMFAEEDARRGADPVALISYELWQVRFEGRPEVIGQRVQL